MASAKFVITDAAKSDIKEILAYIRARSPQSAKAVRLKLRSECRRLGEFPFIGHTRDDVGFSDLRFWTVYSYLIVYRPQHSPIQIIRILHGARDVPSVLSG